MANVIIPKYREGSTGEPTLTKGEIATNLNDKLLFIGHGAGNILFQDKDAAEAYVAQEIAIALTSEMSFKGDYDASTNTPSLDTATFAAIAKGDVYVVTVVGTFFSVTLEVGDTIISKQANATLETHWVIVNRNLDNASIKAAYEANANTNEYSDAEQTKLAGIETAATADQTSAQIKTAYEDNTNTNEFSDAEQTKLAGISDDHTTFSNIGTNSHATIDTKLTSLQSQIDGIDDAVAMSIALG